MNLQSLDQQPVVLWGLGREGWSFLNACARRAVKPKLRLISDATLGADDIRKLDEFEKSSGIEVKTFSGSDIPAAFEACEILVKSPGVSLYRSEIRDARARGVKVTSVTSLWFAEKPQGKIIVLSGTKGKSTTSLLTAKLLEDSGAKVRLGGNIGTPLFDLLDEPGDIDYWVVELSSYQIADAEIKPDIAVLLNLYPEHTDWHGTVERYYSDKLRLLKLLGPDSILIRNSENTHRDRVVLEQGREILFNDPAQIHVSGDSFWDGERRLFPVASMRLFGAHNLSNACAAMSVMKACGYDPLWADFVLRNFQGLRHRLSFVSEKRGVLFVDDSISTVPQSAIAAFQSFPERWITALLGGFERAQDWNELAQGVVQNGVKLVVTLPDCGAKIAGAIKNLARSATDQPVVVYEAKNLDDAVQHAASNTPNGGVVLLSPAAPSYGRFRDFEERGDSFRAIVEQLPD